MDEKIKNIGAKEASKKPNLAFNVDADLVFEVMKNMVDNHEFNQVIIVSGDGDYRKLVSYLIQKRKFRKILFPNKEFASSLYDKFGGEIFDYLENIKNYLQ